MWTKTAVEVDLTDRGSRKGWHYAQVWSTGGGPIGYCTSHDPHPTEQEARECYSAWLRDHLKSETYGDWTGCQAADCDTPTKQGLSLPGGMSGAALCERHLLTNEAVVVLGIDGPAGDSYGS